MHQIKTATVAVWVIVSVCVAAILIVTYLPAANEVLEISRRCRSPNHGNLDCPLCGMTRAFLAITRGEFGKALSLNKGSIALYASFVLNEALFAVYLARKCKTAGFFQSFKKLPANASPMRKEEARCGGFWLFWE